MNDTWWVNLAQLNDEQKAVIALPLEGSHLVLGPPGSGKTNLLLLRANYMTLAGHPNLAVIAFTRNLQEFIAAGSNRYNFPSSKVYTCRKWQYDLLFQYGVHFVLPNTFEEQRVYLIGQINELIQRRKLTNLYEAILLDEAQDYLPEEIEIFCRLAKTLFAVADSRQKIYKGPDTVETLKSYVENHHDLRIHYRNGWNICELADAIAEDSEGYIRLYDTTNYDEDSSPSSIEHIVCPDITAQAEIVVEKLSVQIKAYPNELLGVICPRREEVMQIWEYVQKSPLAAHAVLQADNMHSSFEPDKIICVSTLHAAKGLEFRALHIAGCEFLRNFPLQRNMVYTAVTRAKTSLSFYCSGNIPSFLEGALCSLEPEPDLPTLADVFGGKKNVG